MYLLLCPPEIRPTFQRGKNLSSEFNFSVISPPTWFLFTVSVAAQLPTHMRIYLTCLMLKTFFDYVVEFPLGQYKQ